MADNSAIEWTDATWNPIRARNLKTGKLGWHCEHATTGCEFCYAEGFNKRLGTGLAFKPGHRQDIEIFLDETMLTQPLRWKKPRAIFVCSMTDLFADFVPGEFIDKMFGVMALSPQHTFQVLTKRADRLKLYMTGDAHYRVHMAAWRMVTKLSSDIGDPPAWPLPNVWLGVSAERQQEADERIPLLLQTPAAIRFISAEPLLGPINAARWLGNCHECANVCGFRSGAFEYPEKERCHHCGAVSVSNDIDEFCPSCGHQDFSAVCPSCDSDVVHSHPDTRSLDWIIVGGESGPKARPMHPDWARSLRDQCDAAGVPFFFKQWGEWWFDLHPALSRGSSFHKFEDGTMVERVGKKAAGRHLDGEMHSALPVRR